MYIIIPNGEQAYQIKFVNLKFVYFVKFSPFNLRGLNLTKLYQYSLHRNMVELLFLLQMSSHCLY